MSRKGVIIIKKLLAVAGGLVAVFAFVSYVSAAKSDKSQGPHEQTTGGVVAYAGSTRIDMAFNALGTEPVKGNIQYSSSTGKYFNGTVDVCYSQSGDKAAFAGSVIAGNFSSPNKYFLVEVWDRGEGENAEGSDALRVRLFDYKPDCKITNSFPGIVAEGNIQVHEEKQDPVALENLNMDQSGTCSKIQDGILTYSANHYLEGHPLTIGYDEYGYNYQAHMFAGSYANVYLGGDDFPPYKGDDEAYLEAYPEVESKWYWPYRSTTI